MGVRPPALVIGGVALERGGAPHPETLLACNLLLTRRTAPGRRLCVEAGVPEGTGPTGAPQPHVASPIAAGGGSTTSAIAHAFGGSGNGLGFVLLLLLGAGLIVAIGVATMRRLARGAAADDDVST